MAEVLTEDVVYRSLGQHPLRALMFRPVIEGRLPAIVCMHGGAWISGDRTVPADMAMRLASRGFVVMSIDFRMAPEHRYPSSVQDANYAVRWLRKNAPRYGVDPGRLGGLGFSSGGHLILLAGTYPDDAVFAADIPDDLLSYSAELSWIATCSGVLDPLARYRMAQAAGYAEILACHHAYFGTEACMAEAGPGLRLASAAVAELPPLLMFQGEADPRLPADTAERMAIAYRGAGGVANAQIFSGLGHAVSDWPEAIREQVADRIAELAASVS